MHFNTSALPHFQPKADPPSADNTSALTHFPARLRAAGFTLFELVMVIVLIGILTFTAVPILTSIKTVGLDGAAKQVESHIQYAQSLAVTTGDDYGFQTTTSATNSTYEIYRVSDGVIATSPYNHLPMQEDLSVAYTSTSFLTNANVRFDKDGNATFVSGASPITLINSDGESKYININGTGSIRKQ